MIVETFLLMRKYSQMKKQRDSIIEGYQTRGSPSAGDVIDDTVNKLSSMMLVVIIVVCVLFHTVL